MRKFFILFLVLAMASILITGQGCGKEEVEAAESPYVGGTQGVVAEFEDMGIVEDSIETVWEDESFPLQVNLKNKGEEDIAAGDMEVSLKGILISDFSGIDETDGKKDGRMKNAEKIDSVSNFNKEGGEINIDFGNAAYVVPITGSFYDVSIFAEVVYKYKTQVAVPKVCFNGDPSDTEICDVDEEKTVFSSGAPIQVQRVEEKSAGKGMIALEFEVEDVGGGDVAIPGQEFSPRFDEIEYQLTPEPERDKWECSSGGKVNQARLVDDKTTIRCKLKTENKLAEDTIFTKQIGLEISYKYKSIIHEQLRIKKTG